MTSRRMVANGKLALIALTLAAGLAGCGRGDDGEFQEYGQLDAAGSAAGVTPGNGARLGESPSNSALPGRVLAFSQPPVEAPLPQSIDTMAVVPAIDDGTLTAVEAPIPRTVANGNPPVLLENVNTSPREIKILIKERTFRVEGPEQAIRVSFDDIDLLKVINMDPVTVDAPDKMPQWLRQLDGKRIRIRGYMYPAFKDTGLTAFLIARDTEKCCFGTFAKLYDRFLVRMRKGVTTDYFLNRPFDVVGVLHIDPRADEGELFQMYWIDDAIIVKKSR